MKSDLVFNGNEKKIYATDEENVVLIHYTDTITCYNKVKRARIHNKGIYTNKISALLFDYLQENGIRTHFIRQVNDRDQLCHKIEIVPVEVDVHNIVAGTMARILGLEEGKKLDTTVIDLRYNNQKLGKPLINETRAVALGLMTFEELKNVTQTAIRINELLKQKFEEVDIILVDMKLEFGRAADGNLILSDEISPDRCRLWDKTTGEKLDKDRFRHDEGSITEAYARVYDALSKSLKFRV
ncbi:MAG: phosphoribosylaminoimidazolesuccinocarboxamide synthase [Bacteroidaceae bacterium]|nr:phosphoribosylaminoimidazolesuccinocarboxamide synthase [Bacteroidaceae bacterium]